jgi:hypothetical protein
MLPTGAANLVVGGGANPDKPPPRGASMEFAREGGRTSDIRTGERKCLVRRCEMYFWRGRSVEGGWLVSGVILLRRRRRPLPFEKLMADGMLHWNDFGKKRHRLQRSWGGAGGGGGRVMSLSIVFGFDSLSASHSMNSDLKPYIGIVVLPQTSQTTQTSQI